MEIHGIKFDPKLDLYIEREVEVPVELMWKAWTTPEHLMPWFCPLPWKTVECRIDLKPGGEFFSLMQSPEGENFPNAGCYLEIVPHKKLVWTDALLPGFRPVQKPQSGAGMLFTGTLLFEKTAKGTKYTAIAYHSNETDRATHEKMGFSDGWNKALDQLVEYAKKMKG